MRLKQRGLAALVGVGLVLGAVTSAGAAVQYTVTDLGISNGLTYAINATGQVAGRMSLPDGSGRGFIWNAGQITTLGTLVGGSAGIGINDQGQAVGVAYAGSGSTNPHAVLWQNGTVQDLSTGLPVSLQRAFDINNSGQVVANSSSAAYIWQGGILRDLGLAQGEAINERGQVTGQKQVGVDRFGGPLYHAVLWDNGAVQDLGTLGGEQSQAWDLNDNGIVVGSANVTGSQYTMPETACYWDGTGIHEVPVGGGTSDAYGVNNFGQIVGVYYPGGLYSHAYLYSGGTAQDLNSLIDSGSGWLLTSAWDVNDRGQIVGQGLFQGQSRCFLLTPVPCPATLLLFLPGIWRIGRRGRK